MKLEVSLGKDSYNIYLERGILSQIKNHIDLDRTVLILSDENIPSPYIEEVYRQVKEPYIYKIPAGESSKSLASYEKILKFLIEKRFTRTDCIIALGGGVVGDLAGFVASTYMRGIDFYNVPTSLLSQIDSSIGGKTAIDLSGVKNIVGSFYQPNAVFIDPETLASLPSRQFYNGIAEAIKMALTFDLDFYNFLKEGQAFQEIDKVIQRSLELKRDIVERDEKESSLRKSLNFGHTVGHAIEANSDFIHGEAVAIGMVYFIHEAYREELKEVLATYELPSRTSLNVQTIFESILHDKKGDGDHITIVKVPEPGSFTLVDMKYDDLKTYLDEVHPRINR